MVETRSGKMQDPAQERIKAEESAKPQLGATIGGDASSDPVVLNPNIDIPKYDGTEDPRPWIESLEEIGFLYHWADYIIARYAAMNMTGSAKTWLNLHKASFTSWENIKIRLIQDFSLDANKEELRMKLNRMQHWNEPAIRFAEDILVLCNKVDPAMEEETKIDHVIGGLKKEYSFALYLNPPKTTDELLVVCKKMDSFEKKQYRNNLTQPFTPRRPYNPNFVPKPNLQRNTYNKSQEVSKNRTEDGRPICFKCNKLGHVARYGRVKFIRILEEDPTATQEKIEEKRQMNEISDKSGPRLYADASIEAEDGEYVIEENNRMIQTNGLRLARSLLTVTDRKTHIWITNPYPRPLKIMKDQTLAHGSLPAEIKFIEKLEQINNDEIQFQINKNLSPKKQEDLKQILIKYADLFSPRLGRTNLAKHRIDTEDAKPIKHKPYRVSPKERDIIKDQIDEMLKEGIIRPSSSAWSFPVILVKKRDGKFRFCVDYRKLNEVTVKDVYPIPRIDDVMDTLQGSKYFSAIDLRSGYWQVEIEEKYKEKTAFTTTHGLYEFNVMPFGLCNAPATFERNKDNVLGNLRWQICLCYLDDVIIYSSDFPTHLKRLEAVLKCFSESNLKLNDKKCRFAFEELEILGHITNQQGIKPAEYNIKAVRDFPQPKKVKEVQSFLGMCSYYRKFIKDFSLIADPLKGLIRKNAQFTWTEKQEEAFQNLKKALMNPPILGHFDPNAATYIHTDASNIGLGATLVQIICGEEKVISYLSRTLSKAEQNYSTTEKECLAVVWAISKLRPYLYGRHLKIITYHHSLCWLKNLKDPTGRLARWALKIQEYDFDIIHKSGKKHMDADGLSRGPLPETDWVEDYERLFLNQIINEEDEFIENVKKSLKGSKRAITQNFKEENGCLYKKNPNPEGRAWLLVVPKKRRKEIMSEFHNNMLNGHLGVARTTYRLKNKYHWPSMLKDVSEFVKTCHLCQSRKGSNQSPSGLLQPIPPANYPFERIGIDFVGPLPSTKRRRKWIIVLTDYYTRYAETKAVSEATVKEVSTFLVEQIFLHHGAPRFLISDRGSQFTSNLMKEVVKMCKVKHCFTTSYHPQTNGLTERLNRTLINMISMYVNTDQKNWDEILPFVTHAYNITIQETTGYSPFFLLFGREPMSLLDDDNIPIDSNMNDYDEYIENYLDKIARTRQVVINNAEKTQERMKRNYDKKHNERIYEPGHLVAVWIPVRKIGKCEKLLRKYFGPYRILKKLSNVNYLIEPKDKPGQDPLIVHVSRLKPYFDRIDEVTHQDTIEMSPQPPRIPLNKIHTGEDILRAFSHCFCRDIRDMGNGSTITAPKLKMLTSKPVYRRQYPNPNRLVSKVKTLVDELEEVGIIEGSTSLWNSPLFPVFKTDGSVRITMDLCLINEATEFFPFPIPRVEDNLREFAGAKVFSTLDLTSGFFQIHIPESDRDYFTFSLPWGRYRFTRLPQGAKNSAQVFQWAMNLVLGDLLFKCVRLYIDDVIVYSDSHEQHVADLAAVLERLSKFGLKAKYGKSYLFRDSVEYLGHVIDQNGIKPMWDNVAALRDLKRPHNIRSLLGTVNYYRRFIPNAGEVLAPLSNLLRKGHRFAWGMVEQSAFETVKGILTSEPLLIHPTIGIPFILNTDASGIVVGACLQQEVNGTVRPIAYYSKRLTGPEIRYYTIEKEAYAVVLSLQHFKHLLVGSRVEVHTDHKPITYNKGSVYKNARLSRWAEIIQDFNVTFIYVPGKENTVADFLSRFPCEDDPNLSQDRRVVAAVVRDRRPPLLNSNQIWEGLLQEKGWAPGINRLMKIRPGSIERYNNREYRLQDKYLVTKNEKGTWVKVVPTGFREAVISYHHDIPTGGHFGIKKVMRRLKGDYYWPGMRTQVRKYVRRCESCQLSNQGVARAASAPHFRPEKPFEHLALDFIGPLETTPRGYSSILTIVDLFTKFPILIPTKDQCVNTVVRALLERIITTFGVPKTILSDRGSAFMSCVFKGVCKAMGVGAVKTTAWRPQSNGAVERLNRTVIESLRRCIAGNNWDTTLPMVAFAIRTTVHASTGFTPAKLVFGHELRLPQPFQEEELNPVCEDSITEMAVFYERELVEEVERMREMVRQTYLSEQQEARAKFEARELRIFETGDLVLVKRMHETKGRHKFEPRYKGPYEVLQRAGDTVYLLKDLETGNLDKIHIDRMKAYHAPVKTYPAGDKNIRDQTNDIINDEDHWVHPTYPIYSPRPVEPEKPQETAILRNPLGIVNGVIEDDVGGLEIRRSTRVKKPTGYHWVLPMYPIYPPRPVEPKEPQETAILRNPLGIVNGLIEDNVGSLEIRRSARVKKPWGVNHVQAANENDSLTGLYNSIVRKCLAESVWCPDGDPTTVADDAQGSLSPLQRGPAEDLHQKAGDDTYTFKVQKGGDDTRPAQGSWSPLQRGPAEDLHQKAGDDTYAFKVQKGGDDTSPAQGSWSPLQRGPAEDLHQKAGDDTYAFKVQKGGDDTSPA
ncbi:hypothetical protein LAZ67_13001373, partial [Cordylochernes scorpioides]